MALTALLDTCVLYPAYLRDSLLRLAERGLFAPAWSADILEELHRNLIGALSEDSVDRTIAAMRTAFPAAEIDGHRDLIPALTCDSKDAHVLAATIHGRADLLVTLNTKDFPADSTEPHAVEVVTPDMLLLGLLDRAPRTVLSVLHEQAARYKREPKTVAGLLVALQKGGVPRFADEIRRHLT